MTSTMRKIAVVTTMEMMAVAMATGTTMLFTSIGVSVASKYTDKRITFISMQDGVYMNATQFFFT